MAVLSVANLSKSFDGEMLFSNINFNVNRNERICLLGRNGVGKSTLLKIIIGELDQDDGTIETYGKEIAYLSQSVITSEDNTLLDEMSEVYEVIKTLEKELELISVALKKEATNESLLKQYQKTSLEYERLGGYDYHYQMEKVLSVFGFGKDYYHRTIDSFSGGEKTRVAFAKLLLKKPEVLILDEPTNHLDIEMITWLEGFLCKYEGTILFVSHDHYFINTVATKIVELHSDSVSLYSGNFDYYLTERKVRYEQQMKAFKKQQQERKKMEEFVAKNRVKASKASAAKDRVKKLERMELVSRPVESMSDITFDFDVKSHYKDVLSVENLEIGFEDILASNISFELHGGSKLAIIGPNGTGKTTLLRVLMKQLKPLSGILRYHHPLTLAYFDQNQMNLSEENTVFDEIHQAHLLFDQLKVRSHLAKYLFKGEDVFKKVEVLSGGEKVRLSFAKLALKKHDVMVLDEPTNHLDIDSKEVLFEALAQYDGTMMFISHDRQLINRIATHILYYEDHQFKLMEGNYRDYLSRELPVETNVVTIDQPKAKEKLSNNRRQSLENEVIEIETELEQIDAMMFDEAVYADYQKMEELNERKHVLEARLLIVYDTLYE